MKLEDAEAILSPEDLEAARITGAEFGTNEADNWLTQHEDNPTHAPVWTYGTYEGVTRGNDWSDEYAEAYERVIDATAKSAWDSLLDERREIIRVLAEHGPVYSGGESEVHRIAKEWDENGIGSDELDDWCNARVWCPRTAEQLRDAGISPGTISSSCTDELIYEVCNGDADVDQIIAACK